MLSIAILLILLTSANLYIINKSVETPFNLSQKVMLCTMGIAGYGTALLYFWMYKISSK